MFLYNFKLWRETVLMRAIETLVHSVLLRGHYTAGGDWGRGEGEGAERDACARVQPLMADGIGARVCGTAADGKGGTSEKGWRGENPRNREDHPMIPTTDRRAPLARELFPVALER